MGEKLFDDLARALAEPMPRRRAIRLLGSVLVATSLPGAAFARTRRSAPVRKCGTDERICREFTEKAYCCPSPSWQFFCGKGQGECDNVCSGEAAFPCTGLLPDRLSGFNGVCCNRKLHSGCRPDDPRDRLSGGGSRPQCIPCTGVRCGPNPAYKRNDPRRWACCEKPNTCRKGVCKCRDGRPSCGGRECCKERKECTPCYDQDSLIFTTTGALKCCAKSEFCCVNRCCKDGEGCCQGKCCPKDTECARSLAGRDVCCPDNRVSIKAGRNFCCPAGTYAQPGGCCPFGLRRCCQGQACLGGLCVSGECVTV